MAEKIKLEVVTPSKAVVSEDAQIVVAPGILGEFGVLSGHTPFLTTLKVGTIRYIDANGTEQCVFVSSGFAETLPDKVTVLAESAELQCDIDVERAKSALQRAQDRLDSSKDNVDFARAKAALDRAMHRIRVASQ